MLKVVVGVFVAVYSSKMGDECRDLFCGVIVNSKDKTNKWQQK